MHSTLLALFLCGFISLTFRRNTVLCLLSNELHGGFAGRSLSYSPNHPANDSSFSPVLSDPVSSRSAGHTSGFEIILKSSNFKTSTKNLSENQRSSLPSRTANLISQTDQPVQTFPLNHFNGSEQSQHLNENVLDNRLDSRLDDRLDIRLNNRLNKNFAMPARPTNNVPSNSIKPPFDLKQIFDKVYKSNYVHFCPCPPELSGAHHSLKNAEDRTVTECIYLPLTTVQYRCIQTASSKQSSRVVDRLICDLNQNTNQLDWIIDEDDLLVYRDQFTSNQRSQNEEIGAQSAHSSDFRIEFLQCNRRKWIFSLVFEFLRAVLHLERFNEQSSLVLALLTNNIFRHRDCLSSRSFNEKFQSKIC